MPFRDEQLVSFCSRQIHCYWLRPSLQALAVAFAAHLVCCGCNTTPSPGGGAISAIQIPLQQRDAVWERAVSVLNRSHFRVARESKLEGVIETDYRAGASLLEPWHPDSIGFGNRLESTLQSIRRRVIVTMQSSASDVMVVNVRVDKEIEDLPGLAALYEGGATFREAQPMNRDLTQVVGQSSPSRWVPIGRDVWLERRLMQQIQAGQ